MSVHRIEVLGDEARPGVFGSGTKWVYEAETYAGEPDVLDLRVLRYGPDGAGGDQFLDQDGITVRPDRLRELLRAAGVLTWKCSVEGCHAEAAAEIPIDLVEPRQGEDLPVVGVHDPHRSVLRVIPVTALVCAEHGEALGAP